MTPNLLLITTDQQSATMMSCTGNTDLHTPNLDRLSSHGVRFEQAFAAQPLCVPQRCSWYTGRMPHEHGVHFNLRDREVDAPTMMGRIFREAGYATGYSGKWHVMMPVEDRERHGFEWVNNIRTNGADEGIAPDFARFLEEKDGRPFLFSASYNNPHNICEAARGGPFPDGNPGLPDTLVSMPPLPDNFDPPAEEPTILRVLQSTYSERHYPVADWDEMRWRLHRWQYARMVEMVDRHIGNLIQILKDHQLERDTLIVFTSDHGDGNAHHRWNQKMTLYDESARVPFMICRIGDEGGRVDLSHLVNTGIDLIPTLCGLGGVPVPDHLEGMDLSPVLRSQPLGATRDHVIVETEFGDFGRPSGVLGRAVVTADMKYMVYNQGEHREFLVERVLDPGETTNLASDPAYAGSLEHHRELLRTYIRSTDDIFPLEAVGEGSLPIRIQT